MKSIGTKTLETERLILRRFTVADAPFGYKNWTADPLVTKYLTWKPHASVSETEYIFKLWEDDYANLDYYQWVIVLKEINEPIGSIGVVRFDQRLNSCEIGYVIGRNYWGRGIMPEAFSKVIEFLFEEAEFGKIAALHDVNNPNSGKVMKKCGLTLEGVLRRNGKNNSGICDTAVYSILDDEYFNRLKKD